MKKTFSILVLLLVGFSGNVFALDTSDCIKIKDDAKRLTCFDEIYSSSNVIAHFEGQGLKYTLPFIVKDSFEIHWKYTEDEEPKNLIPMFGIDIMNENAEVIVNTVMNIEGIESGVSYYPKKGKYYLGIYGAGSWSVTIISSD